MIHFQELEDFLQGANRQMRNSITRTSSFMSTPSEEEKSGEEKKEAKKFNLEFLSTITKLFEDNKIHQSQLDQFIRMKGTDKEFIVDKAKFREKLEEENTGDAKVADVLEAFDLFFESHEAKKKIIKQSEFSALLRENELKLLGNTF